MELVPSKSQHYLESFELQPKTTNKGKCESILETKKGNPDAMTTEREFVLYALAQPIGLE